MAPPQLARDEWRIGKAESLAAGLNVSRLKMAAAVRFECSLYSIIVSSALAEWPVATLDRDDLLAGNSLVDLYRALDELTALFRGIGNELRRVCHQSNIAFEFYGSSRPHSGVQLQDANRALLDMARHARDAAAKLDLVLKPGGAVLDALNSIAHIYPYVTVVQDFLTVTLRSPNELPANVGEAASSAERLGLIKAPEIFDNMLALDFLGELGSMMLNDFNQLVREIDDYRTALRSRVG